MNTLKEIAYNIAEIVGAETDFATIRRLEEQVLHHRALILRRTMDRSSRIGKEFISTIVADTEIKDGTDYADFGIPLCVTKQQIPYIVDFKEINGFTYVGSIDKVSAYTRLMCLSDLRFIDSNRYSQKRPYYVYEDNKIYITYFPEKLLIRGVFEDPRKLVGFKDLDDNPTWEESMPLPISADLLQMVVQAVVSSEATMVRFSNKQEVTIESNKNT